MSIIKFDPTVYRLGNVLWQYIDTQTRCDFNIEPLVLDLYSKLTNEHFQLSVLQSISQENMLIALRLAFMNELIDEEDVKVIVFVIQWVVNNPTLFAKNIN